MHELPFLLQIEEGKTVKMLLKGVTSKQDVTLLSLLEYRLQPVAIGTKDPPSQILQLHNNGTCAIDYVLDLTKMKDLNQQNYEFPIFTFTASMQG